MSKNIEFEKRESEKTKKFVEKYWPTALLIAGAAGAIGAGIWLTARYLRDKKRRSKEMDQALELVQKEVELGSDEAAVLLETGPFLGEISGEEGKKALMELANEMDDEQARQALELLKQVIMIDGKM